MLFSRTYILVYVEADSRLSRVQKFISTRLWVASAASGRRDRGSHRNVSESLARAGAMADKILHLVCMVFFFFVLLDLTLLLCFAFLLMACVRR